MAEIKTKLIQAGPGEYYGAKPNSRALVIYPSKKILAPEPPLVPLVEKSVGRTAFLMLFDRVVTWKPVQSCRDVAMRILPDAKLTKFLKVAETDSPAQVRFG